MGKNTGVRGVEEQAMEENFVLEKLNSYVDRMCMADWMYLKRLRFSRGCRKEREISMMRFLYY
jgi:hypothetical protein